MNILNCADVCMMFRKVCLTILNSANVRMLFRKVNEYYELCRWVNAIQKGLWIFWTLQMCEWCSERYIWLFWTLQMWECYSERSMNILNSADVCELLFRKVFEYWIFVDNVKKSPWLFWTLENVWMLFREVDEYSELWKMCECFLERSTHILSSGRCVNVTVLSKIYDYSELCRCVNAI